MRLYIKKLVPNAIMPKYAKAGDAGLDLTATSIEHDHLKGYVEYGTGLAMSIPDGYVGLLFPRSSISNTGMALSNCVGIIDSGYRGEIKARFRVVDHKPHNYKVGDRILQLIVMPYPEVIPVETDTLEDTERGIGGFGSSGK